jgi:hypothetical protein
VSFDLREDSGGPSPPGTSGEQEEQAFNADAAAHRLKLRKLELGMFGFLGAPASAATNVALLGMLLGLVFSAACLIASYNIAGEQGKFLQSFAERAFGFSVSCLTFIFGRSTAKSQD